MDWTGGGPRGVRGGGGYGRMDRSVGAEADTKRREGVTSAKSGGGWREEVIEVLSVGG